jgi:hypothetical protein
MPDVGRERKHSLIDIDALGIPALNAPTDKSEA